MLPCVLMAVGAIIGLVGPDSKADTQEYARLKGETGRDANSQVKLALWCEAHGLETERIKHLAIAVLTDPSHALARGLLGMVEQQGKWKRPDAIAEALKSDLARADLIALYNGKRVQTAVSVLPQYKLGLWCEENGLKDEARAHFATVVRLNPNHAEAWKKLGYKKVNNRWLTEAQAAAIKAEKEAQDKADTLWRPRLLSLRDTLASKGKHEAAEKALGEITDPRAVPMVWKVFVEKGEAHHLRAVQLFGQIDAVEASRSLATLALFSPKADVRSRATETLRRRDPREYADLLIPHLREKIKYEVRHVGGPGSPGELYVEGKKQNLKRFYAPPPAPYVPVMPGYTVQYDANGMMVLVENYSQPSGPTVSVPGPRSSAAVASAYGWMGPANLNQGIDQSRGHLPPGMQLNNAQILGLGTMADPILQAQLTPLPTEYVGNPQGVVIGTQKVIDTQLRIPVGRMAAEAERVAMSAEQQLAADLKLLEDQNKLITESNDRVGSILNTATGANLPFEPETWKKWYVDQLGFKYNITNPDEVPTVVENVPLLDQAQPIPVQVSQQSVIQVVRHSCFGKGTLVQTVEGPRPIETIRLGDRVLTQNAKTGKLGYQPVVMVHHNPPSPTYRVMLNDRPIVTSYTHRFWKAGQGWVMARDLKVDDSIRTLGSVARVTSIEADKVQPVFNLDVAGDADFFAGEVAALVHDNTLPDLKLTPFDAPAGLAVAKP